MSTTEDSSSEARGTASGKDVDLKLEVVVIPVSDVARAKDFYGGLVGGSTPTSPLTTAFESCSSRRQARAPRSSSAPT
jgi:hypothetical protein